MNDAFVSIFVTDEAVFGKIEQKFLPPSFLGKVYLEHEVNKTDY